MSCSFTTTYEQLLTEVLPYVPGCPDVTAINAMRNAAIDFFNRSLVWQMLNEPDTIGTGEDAYQIPEPEQGELAQIMELWIDGANILPTPPDALRYNGAGVWPTNTGTPRSWILQDFSRVRFIPLPDKNYQVVTRVAYRPTLDSTALEDSMYRDYWPHIRAGALARILEIPGQSWSNDKMSMMNESRFERGVGKAKIDANRGRTRAELRIELPRFP